MAFWSTIAYKIKEILKGMVGARTIEQTLHVAPVISSQMEHAIQLWTDMYKGEAEWIKEPSYALSDPSPKGSTATTNVGGNLALALPDSTDLRQQWNFVAQADDYYNIISRWSGHAANLNSGNAADGTRVISYTSNERDKLSSNRLWLPVVAGTMDTGIETPTMDYALAYDDANGRLHFGAENLQQLTFTVGVYNVKGHRVGTFRACDDFNMLPYPAGLYIVTWSENGRKHSVKLKK